MTKTHRDCFTLNLQQVVKGKKTDYKFNFLEFVSCLKVEINENTLK